MFRTRSLPPRRRGETQEAYNRRVRNRRLRTVGGGRRRLVDSIVGTPTRRKRPTVDPRRQRRKPLTPEQRANLSNLMEQQRRKVNQFNRNRRPQLPKPVGSPQKPLTPEQRKKLQGAVISQRQVLEALARAKKTRGKPKTTRGVAIPLKQTPKRPTGRGKRVTTIGTIPSRPKKRAR